MPINRLKRKITKEVLWLYILRLLKDKLYTANELRTNINRKFKFESTTVTSYVVLFKLENDGYVKSEWIKLKSRSPKKYYKITSKGKELFMQGKFFLRDIYDKLFKK